MTDASRAHIRAIAARIERLSPSHRHPERFEEDKSEIAEELRRIAEKEERRG